MSGVGDAGEDQRRFALVPKKQRQDESKPIAIDLFCGVGGLSLGAARAGFWLAAAVDTDKISLETHSKNFPNAIHIPKTVRTLTGRDLLENAQLKAGQVDVLMGGPPCQGFSVIGHRNTQDHRNFLFSHFFRLVSEIKPRFFVVENVPGILADEYASVRYRATEFVRSHYQCLEAFKVTASEYGTPTRRTRVFFIGSRNDVRCDLTIEDFSAPKASSTVRVGEALRGLPIKINANWQTEDEGWRQIGNPKETPFLRKAQGVIPNGVGDPFTIDRCLEKRQVSGCLGTIHEKDVVARFSLLLPGEKDPVSKATRLDSRGFCPTLRAGTGPDRGSYQAVRPIHYREPRVITPREAARLQGFPDWFRFHATKWHSFRQIGNSVSPIVGQALMSVLARAMRV